MTTIDVPRRTFSFSGGRLCLDFCNTVGGRHKIEVATEKLKTNRLVGEAGYYNSAEHLGRYIDLVEWGRQATILTADEAAALETEAERRPAEALAVLEQAHELREAMYRIFSAIADGQLARETDLATLNAALPRVMAQLRIAPDTAGYHWVWDRSQPALDSMLWPIVRSATELLTSVELDRVRECEGETCGWMFMDTSKNRSRRWCSMDDCGNRAKAKRHYQRVKGKRND